MDEPRPAPPRRFLSLSGICRQFGLSPHTLRRAIRSREIGAFRLPSQRRLRIDPVEVEAWIRGHRIEVKPGAFENSKAQNAPLTTVGGGRSKRRGESHEKGEPVG